MKCIVALITGAIGVIVAISLINPITKTIQTATTAVTTTLANGVGTTTTTPTYSGAVQGIAGVLPIVFIVIIILGTVSFMGFSGGDSEEKEETNKQKQSKTVEVTVRTNSGRIVNFIMNASKSLEPYFNNLDELLGIKTVIDNHKYFGLDLTGITLAINEEDYDWYITAKQKDENVFKVVGLNKKDSSNNQVYILGTRLSIADDGQPIDKPFLIKVPVTRVSDEIKSPKELFSGYYTK